MSWRVVAVSEHCKLDLKMGYMVVRGADEEKKRILLDEVAVLIIESTAVSLTAALLAELVKKKIKVIFCDEKRNPSSELVSYYSHYSTSGKLKAQIGWNSDIKSAVWTKIVAEKIRSQSEHLNDRGYFEAASILAEYIKELQPNDSTNREAAAARLYFSTLFGQGFSRAQENPVNAALNYGYSIILSAFNREIVSSGYLTQIGIYHDNAQNPFNLSSDLMEPFRVLVDRKVCEGVWTEFNKNAKYDLMDLLNDYVLINDSTQTVLNAIKLYTKSVLSALDERDVSLIRFITQ